MPTTRQKRKSAEADDDSSIKSEIPVPAKVKKNESGLKKVSSKNGPTRKTNSGYQRKGRQSNQNTKSEPDSEVEQNESVDQIDNNEKVVTVTASGNLKMVSEGKSTGKRKGQKSPAVAVKKTKQDDQKCSKMASSKEQKIGKKDKRNTQKIKVKTESVKDDESEMKKEKETSDTHSVKVEGNNHGHESSSTDSDDAFVDVDADSLSKGLNASELPSARIKQVRQLGNKSIRKTSASKEKKLSTRKGSNIKKSNKKKMNVESAGTAKPYASEQDDSNTENEVKSEHQANLSLMKENDVARVLMHMEGPSAVADGPSTMDNITSSNEKGFSSEESDWEEVEDDPNSHTTPKKSQLPSGPVQIRLDVPDLIKKKRKKKAFDWKIYFNRMLNRFKKALLIDMHKVHLLCLLSHGFHCVRSVRSALIHAQALSLLPTNILKKRPESFDVAALTSLTQWFVGMITVDSQLKDGGVLETVLVERFSRQKVANEKERVLLFFVILCVLRLDTRFIFSVQPLPLKATGKESKGSSLKSKASKSVSENERNRKSKMATSKSKSMNDEAKCSKEGKVAKSDEKSSKYFKNAANCRLKESKTKTLKNNGNPKTDEKPIADAKNIGGKTSKHSKQIESDATVESYDSGPSQRKPRAANNTETDDKPVSDVKNNSGKRSKHSKQIESDATVESYDSGPSQRKPRAANNTETDDKPVSDVKNNSGKRSKHSKQIESDATVESYDSGPSQRKPRAANNTETDEKPVSDIKNNGGKRSKHSKQIESDATVESCDSGPSKRNLRTKNSQRRSHASKISANKMKQDLDSEDDFEIPEEESTDSDYSNYSEEEEVKKRDKKSKSKRATKKTKGSSDSQQSSLDSSQLSSDDFEEEETKFRNSPTYNIKRKYNGGKVSRKVVSSDSDESHSKSSLKIGNDFWLEVFLESDNKWICVDVARNAVNKPEAMEKSASQPVTYVLGFEKDESVKDVTCRYASQWMSHTRKLRVDSDWWGETLAPYRSKNCDREENEDLLLKAQLTQKPLPQVIGDYKNHPLYALRRHLLKFEAIYPDTAIPLGYVRKEPVYARYCVHTLHSRDNWLKEGRVVKLGETAYKMVKSRPKWNKPKENPDELDLELFGVWQTEIYVPPPAENGKIYKNEYGNIELFKPSMLPAGTVHIRIEGLKKVAKKLDVDCVPAMVGWDHHSGFAHPILDGFVVCEEHEDILLSAWEEEQELQRQREEQKRIKRIYGNWKIIVRGLLIRERLKHRFDLQNSSHIEENKAKARKGEKATDAAVSWPSNRQQKKGKQQKKSSAAQNCLVEVEQL